MSAPPPPISNRSVAMLVGSLRKDSMNRKMALALKEIAAPGLKLDLVEIGELPFFNQDREVNPPAEWVRLKKDIRAADAVLFVTPEYNRSVPGALKNAIDAASRPYGDSAFDGKPGAVVTVSQGAIGGFGANHHLRQMMVFLNVPMLAQPEAYIGGAAKKFDEAGKLTDDSTRDFLKKFADAFAGWVEKNLNHSS